MAAGAPGSAQMAVAWNAAELASIAMGRPGHLQNHREESLPGPEIPSKVDGGSAAVLSAERLRYSRRELMANFMHLPQLTHSKRFRYYF